MLPLAAYPTPSRVLVVMYPETPSLNSQREGVSFFRDFISSSVTCSSAISCNNL